MFLQAAGMDRRTIRRLPEWEGAPGLSERQQVLAAFARKLTRYPKQFSHRDTELLREVVADEGEVIEAANVVAGFNFANRVADALDAPCEVPNVLRRRTWIKNSVMNVMSLGMRVRMNFKNRTLRTEAPDQILLRLEKTVRSAGMGQLPCYLYQLRLRPHVLAGHAAILASLLRDSGFSAVTILRIRYIASCLNGDSESMQESARLLRESGASVEELEQIINGRDPAADTHIDESRVLLFARDVTLHAHKTTDEQVSLLRDGGLSDLQILNLVLIIASHNSANRMNLALAQPRCEGEFSEQNTLVESL